MKTSIPVQFTYGLRPPLDANLQAEFGLKVRKAEVILRNIPPATVYVYRKDGLGLEVEQSPRRHGERS